MFTFMQTGVARRVVRTLGLVGFGLAAAQCSDRTALDPNATPANAQLSVQPQFSLVPGAPTVTLARIRASLVARNGDSTVTSGSFQNGSASLHFAIPILGGPTEFLLNVQAFDTQDLLAYKFSKKIIITPGQVTTVAQPTLEYVAADAAVTKLAFSPSTLQLNAGASGGFTVTGTSSGGQPISPVRLAFTSKDPSIATVDPNTGAVTAGPSQGSTYIIAHTVIGVVDSALVKVHAPVDKVLLAPATLSIVRGQKTAVAAELRDAGSHLIDDRTATFASADSTIATVSQAGVVTGVAIGKTTITASAEGKTATTAVTVTSPVDHIELPQQAIQLASIGESVTLVVKVVPVAGASVDGLTSTFTSSNPSVAVVDSKGVVAAVGNGTATITADVDGNQATTTVTVKQVVTGLSVSPRAVSVTSIGATQTFAALAVDARGNPVQDPAIQWTSSDPTVATVDANGTATARRAGSTTISATVNGKTDAVTFIVVPVAKLLIIVSDKAQIAAGQVATLSAKFADEGGSIIRDAPATFTNTTPNVAVLTGNVLTGLSAGTAHITATAGGLSGSIDIKVTGGTKLTISPPAVQRLTNGTQQFTASGGTGIYDWSVNGTPGGNTVFGTITATGFYTAPSLVPEPATFDVCASDHANPAVQGCASVTIGGYSPGGDVLVFNDENMFDDTYGVQNSNNPIFYRNLVQFSAAGLGPRATQTGVMMHRGHHSGCGTTECAPAAQTHFYSTLTTAGFTIVDVGDPAATIGPIPSSIKVIFLWMPVTPYSPTEINTLKQFSAEGGRIVFVGEWDGYYTQAGISTENAFFASMGAQMTNQGGRHDCGYVSLPASSLRPHQVTTGLTGLGIACASEVIPGPNDQILFYDSTGKIVLAAVAKVDLTPISASQAARTVLRSTKPASSLSAPSAPAVHGWGPDTLAQSARKP